MEHLKKNITLSVLSLWCIFGLTSALFIFGVIPVSLQQLEIFSNHTAAMFVSIIDAAIYPMFLSALIIGMSTGFKVRDKDNRTTIMRAGQLIFQFIPFIAAFSIAQDLMPRIETAKAAEIGFMFRIMPYLFVCVFLSIISAIVYQITLYYATLVQEREEKYKNKPLWDVQKIIIRYILTEFACIILPIVAVSAYIHITS